MKRTLILLPCLSLLLLSACQTTEQETDFEENKIDQQEINTENKEVDEASLQEEKKEDSDLKEEAKTEAKVNPVLEPKVELKVQNDSMGWIEGSVSYPSEGLPEDLEVCAGQIEGNMYCTNQWIENKKYDYGFGYKLAVPPGLYQVMAQRSSGGLIGWYSNFVACGQTADCTDHKPLEVTVKASEGTQNIDPADWY